MTLVTINSRSSYRRARQLEQCRAAYVEARGDASDRAGQIASLPSKDWKGQPVYALTCHGTSGKGPHECYVPESLLWALIDLGAFRCPYHAGDAA